MTLTTPLDTQDAVYPAALDRMRLKASGVQAGVVGTEDLKVSAASGLQVSVAAGQAYIQQTNALEGSFYDGLYLVGNDGPMTPSGTPTVSATLPQLAQIILRVFDVTELKIAGSSYAKLEWLNGTFAEGVTLENRLGAAELPQSSLRLADVLIPKGAESSASFEIRDRAVWAEGGQERRAYSERGGGSVSTGMIANAAVTGAKLGEGTVRLLSGAAYGTLTARGAGVEYEPSASRPTFVTLTNTGIASYSLYVGGVLIAEGIEPHTAASFVCPPGVKWKMEGNTSGKSSYLTL